jgi:hypothetical protein
LFHLVSEKRHAIASIATTSHCPQAQQLHAGVVTTLPALTQIPWCPWYEKDDDSTHFELQDTVCSHPAASVLVAPFPSQHPSDARATDRPRLACPARATQANLRKVYMARNVLKVAHLLGLAIAMVMCFFPHLLLTVLHADEFTGNATTAMYVVMGLLGNQIFAISSIRGDIARGAAAACRLPPSVPFVRVRFECQPASFFPA